MSVLRLMDYALANGTTQVQPDYDCFRYLLLAATKRPLLPDLGSAADVVLSRMASRLMVPDTECYHAAIQTWTNAALNTDLLESRNASVKRVLELLSQMRVAHNQSSTVSVEPTTQIINKVLEVLSVSSHPRRMEQAELLLLEMEAALRGDTIGPKPNAQTYTLVINIWRGSMSAEMVPRARAILRRMEKIFEQLPKGADKHDEIVGTFNAFIRVCAATEVKNADRGKEVLKDALAAFESLLTLEGFEPNAATYSNLLVACGSLVAPGRDRQMVIDKVFRICCDAGMVDDDVLLQLRAYATPEHFSKLVVAASEDFEGTRLVPESWTTNALGGRVVSADGRRTKPLSIDGKLTVTTAMQDFQMRRMTDKRNRNLLRGGRQSKPYKFMQGTFVK
jgi:hypothetical protein